METSAPLGGKVSTGAMSASHAAEMARYQQYKNALLSLPRINGEETARKYRSILVANNPKLGKLFRALNLLY